LWLWKWQYWYWAEGKLYCIEVESRGAQIPGFAMEPNILGPQYLT
jgi:hypothetical protein